MKNLIPLLLIIFSVGSAIGQTVCTQTLREARTVYDEGRIQILPELLESCINSGFTEEEKTEAYRLLILSYIYLDEPTKADEAMLALLRHNPQFKINEQADPAELINLYKTFRTRPIFNYGIKAGGNLTLIEVTKNFSTLNPRFSDGEYQLNPGYQVGFSLEKSFSDLITANLEIYFNGNITVYENSFSGLDSINRFIESQNIRLTQTSISVPLTVQFAFLQKSKFNPYIFLGGSVNYLLSSTFNGETNTINESFEGATVDLISQRKSLNFSGVSGLGMKLDVGKNTFLTEVRLSYGILNQVEGSERYKNQTLIYDYGYIDNDFKLHSVSLSVGYIFPFYNPKKLVR